MAVCCAIRRNRTGSYRKAPNVKTCSRVERSESWELATMLMAHDNPVKLCITFSVSKAVCQITSSPNSINYPSSHCAHENVYKYICTPPMAINRFSTLTCCWSSARARVIFVYVCVRGWDRKSKNMHTAKIGLLFTRGISRRVPRRTNLFYSRDALFREKGNHARTVHNKKTDRGTIFVFLTYGRVRRFFVRPLINFINLHTPLD